MKSKINNWLTIVIVLLAGILLIVWHSRIDILQWIIIAVAVMLIVPSVYSFIAAVTRKHSTREHRAEARAVGDSADASLDRSLTEKQEGLSAGSSSIWASIGAIALGMWMLFDPIFFVGLLAYVFGAILVLYGIYHIVVLSYWSRPVRMPGWFYIIPVLMILAGLALIFTNIRTMNDVIVLVTGIALVASAVNSIMETVVSDVSTRPLPPAGE